jgi:hypothetical protein
MQQTVMAYATATQDFTHKSADEFDAESSKPKTALIVHACLSRPHDCLRLAKAVHERLRNSGITR